MNRFLSQTALLFLFAAAAHAGHPAAAPRPVKIYLEGAYVIPPAIAARAESIAAHMFATAGVRVSWSHEGPSRREAAQASKIVVQFKRDEWRRPECVLAFTRPYAGSEITILYDRLRWAEPDTPFAAELLAHTLVHEITHNLQRIARHSETGVMKAVWTGADYFEMRAHPLPFTPLDIRLIQEGLEQRN